MGYKEDFISIYQEHISREGSKELLEWLQTTDFLPLRPAQNFIAHAPEDWCSTASRCIR